MNTRGRRVGGRGAADDENEGLNFGEEGIDIDTFEANYVPGQFEEDREGGDRYGGQARRRRDDERGDNRGFRGDGRRGGRGGRGGHRGGRRGGYGDERRSRSRGPRNQNYRDEGNIDFDEDEAPEFGGQKKDLEINSKSKRSNKQ